MLRNFLIFVAVVCGVSTASIASAQYESFNRYITEVQWGGSSAPWHSNGEFILGGRDQQRLVAINVMSPDGGKTLIGCGY